MSSVLDTGDHAAILEVRDVVEARQFYLEQLGCTERQAGGNSLRVSLSANSIECRLSSRLCKVGNVARHYRLRRGAYRPVAHVRVELPISEWRAFRSRLRHRRIKYELELIHDRTQMQPAEFELSVRDPSGNVLEFTSTLTHRDLVLHRCRSLCLAVGSLAAVAMVAWWIWLSSTTDRASTNDPTPLPASLIAWR